MNDMFYGCSELTSIDVSHFDTGKVLTLGGMFYNCKKLSNIDVSGFDTSKVYLFDTVFYGCSNLTSLDVSHFDTHSATNMFGMFEGCSSLTELDVSGFNTENVTTMLQMFYGCRSLMSLDVSNFNTSKVTNMKYMFRNCNNLENLDVSNFDTRNVTDMSNMFSNCNSLLRLDVSNFETSNVTKLGGMFGGCSRLSVLDVSHFNTKKVTEMYSLFEGCQKLSVIYIGNFDTKNVTNMTWMFGSCTNLKTIYVGDNWDITKVKNYTGMFGGCTSLVGGSGTVYDSNHTDVSYAHIDGGPSNPGYLTDKNAAPQEKEAYAVFTDDGTLAFYYDELRNSREGTTYDLKEGGVDSPKWYGKDIKKVVFVSSFSDVKPETMSLWFCKAINLEEITGLENLNTIEVKSMSHLFYGCRKLTTLDLSYFDTHNVEEMDDMFCDSENLKTIYVGEGWNTETVTYSSGMFSGCTSLVGGSGTVYDSNYTDVSYAHIDGGPSNPGYLTAKNVTPLVSNSDDLLEFILSLGENKGTEDAPAVVPVDENGLSIDKDVAIEDDLYLALYGKDESTPLPVYFVEGASLTPLIGSHFIFVNSSLNDSPAQTRRTNAETDYAGGINNKGCVTFANSTLNEGAYRVNNCTEGVLTLKANTTVGSDVLVNSGQIYTDGTVAVGSMTHRPGGKMYITGSLTRDINMSIDASDVELDVPIILGGEGYSLTEADLGYIHLTLPVGNEWKYDAVQGGIVISQATGMISINAGQPDVVDSYDATGRKVGIQHNGLTLQRKSDGTVKKAIIKK